jgi:hypothetical protein
VFDFPWFLFGCGGPQPSLFAAHSYADSQGHAMKSQARNQPYLLFAMQGLTAR